MMNTHIFNVLILCFQTKSFAKARLSRTYIKRHLFENSVEDFIRDLQTGRSTRKDELEKVFNEEFPRKTENPHPLTTGLSHPSLHRTREASTTPRSPMHGKSSYNQINWPQVVCKPSELRAVKRYSRDKAYPRMFEGLSPNFGSGGFGVLNTKILIKARRCKEIISQLKGSNVNHRLHKLKRKSLHTSRHSNEMTRFGEFSSVVNEKIWKFENVKKKSEQMGRETWHFLINYI